MQKYKLTSNQIVIVDIYGNERTLYQIQAYRDIQSIEEGYYVNNGELGGYIENEDNLSQVGKCWVYAGSLVYGDARVYDDAIIAAGSIVCDYAQVYQSAFVIGKSLINGYAKVCGCARISSFGSSPKKDYNVHIYEHAQVCDNASINGDCQIYGCASIRDFSILYHNTKVYDNAIVCGRSVLRDDVQVYENGYVGGKFHLQDKAQVYGHARLTGTGTVADDVMIYGTTHIDADDATEFFFNGYAKFYGNTIIRINNNLYRQGITLGYRFKTGDDFENNFGQTLIMGVSMDFFQMQDNFGFIDGNAIQ